MALRSKPLILRIHSSKKKEYMESVYSELLLYFPWKSEKELKGNKVEECLDLFNKNNDIIKKNKGAIFPKAAMIDAMIELLDSNENTKPHHIADDINPAGEQSNLDNQEILDRTNPLDISDLPAESEVQKCNQKPDSSPYKPIPNATQDELLQMARNLSFNQRIVFDKMIAFSKSIIRAEKGKDLLSAMPPPLLIVHGGGGVGKSYLIRATSQWVNKILREGAGRDNIDQPTVLLMAFTGVAAKNIGGTTLHTGLSFKFGADMLDFSSEKLDISRKNLENVEVVVVDEFSMISADNLYNLHKRLQEIFISQELFGGRSVLLVGDIMQLGKDIFRYGLNTSH